MRLIQVYTIHVRAFLGSAQCDEMVEEEHEHDLSHEVFYHKNGYSLFRPIGGMDCKDTVYTLLRGTKAANSCGGIYLKYEADFKDGRTLRYAALRSVRPSGRRMTSAGGHCLLRSRPPIQRMKLTTPFGGCGLSAAPLGGLSPAMGNCSRHAGGKRLS